MPFYVVMYKFSKQIFALKEQRENNNAEHVDISSLVYRILNRYDMEGMK